jgi:hypothetical protein
MYVRLKLVEALVIFAERSSTIECYCHPPPNLEMIESKRAWLIKQTNIFTLIKTRARASLNHRANACSCLYQNAAIYSQI